MTTPYEEFRNLYKEEPKVIKAKQYYEELKEELQIYEASQELLERVNKFRKLKK